MGTSLQDEPGEVRRIGSSFGLQEVSIDLGCVNKMHTFHRLQERVFQDIRFSRLVLFIGALYLYFKRVHSENTAHGSQRAMFLATAIAYA